MSFVELAEPLDRRGGPLYRQAADRLRGAIQRGLFRPGDSLPTETELAHGFSVSLITIRGALRELEAERLIRKRPAKTAMVIHAPPPPAPADPLAPVLAALHGARLDVAAYRPARSAEAARLLGQDVRAMLPCLRGRLLREAAPLAELAVFHPPAIGARLRREDFDDPAPFRTLERRLGLSVASVRLAVAARLADPALAEALGCPAGAPLLQTSLLCSDAAGAPLQLVLARHHPGRLAPVFDLQRR